MHTNSFRSFNSINAKSKMFLKLFLIMITIFVFVSSSADGLNSKKFAVKSADSVHPFVSLAVTPSGHGYWGVAEDGGVFASGDAGFFGSTGGIRLNSPIITMAAVPDGKGYWLAAGDGGIFTFGNAGFHGSTGGMKLNSPVVGMTPTPTGKGYWMVAGDGGVFAFGDAKFYGSTGGMKLNKPIVAMTPTKTGKGYWLVASDGGVFAFGDAGFYGSTGGVKLIAAITGIARTTSGNGYWMVARDGGIFAFGDAGFYGATSGNCMRSATIAMDRARLDGGYFTLTANGQVSNFGPGHASDCPAPPPSACNGNTSSKKVIVSIDEQHMWLCEYDYVYFDTPVTTGAEKNGHGTPTGNFAVYSKQTNTYLTGPGYRAHVDYWMPFIRGYGLHDASWRSQFGVGTYGTAGSHGCVNIPPSAMPTVYNWGSIGTPVQIRR